MAPPFLGHFFGLYPSIMIRFPCLLLYRFATVYLGVLIFPFSILFLFFFYFFLELGGLCIFFRHLFFYITFRRAA
ncbi:hypothetical protein DFP73DRAFT_61030 [Morchella snyderi]|nr:hypothetical protein DFP73DRAFT_61030 [Morchella snyderi]